MGKTIEVPAPLQPILVDPRAAARGTIVTTLHHCGEGWHVGDSYILSDDGPGSCFAQNERNGQAYDLNQAFPEGTLAIRGTERDIAPILHYNNLYCVATLRELLGDLLIDPADFAPGKTVVPIHLCDSDTICHLGNMHLLEFPQESWLRQLGRQLTPRFLRRLWSTSWSTLEIQAYGDQEGEQAMLTPGPDTLYLGITSTAGEQDQALGIINKHERLCTVHSI